MRGATKFLLSMVCLCCATSAALANPLDTFGFGARGQGLGGAYTAHVDDFSANYYNPSGLAVTPGLRLELGYALHQPYMEINDADVGVDPSKGLHGGVVVCGPVFGRNFAASVGLYLPDGVVSRIRALPESQPRFVLVDNRPQRLVITTSIALELFDDFFVGGGVSFLANTRGVVDIRGDVAFFDAQHTELMSSLDVELNSVRYPSIGMAYRPGNHWRIGLTWREEFILSMDMKVRVSGDIINDENMDEREVVVADASFLMNALNSNLFSPRQVALGIAYEESSWLVAMDVTWLQWSRFPAPTATLDFDLDLGGLPFQIPPQPVPGDPGFHDIMTLRLGGELRAHQGHWGELELRLGYGLEPSPVPEQRGHTNYIDGLKHTFSFGLGLALSDLAPLMHRGLEFNLSLQAIWLPELEVVKTDPADTVGNYAAQGLSLGGTLTMSLLF
jgi:long-chain fatty acid transport protein